MRVHRSGGVPERSNGTDCKSVASASKVRILLPPHKTVCELLGNFLLKNREQAEVAQLVER